MFNTKAADIGLTIIARNLFKFNFKVYLHFF